MHSRDTSGQAVSFYVPTLSDIPPSPMVHSQALHGNSQKTQCPPSQENSNHQDAIVRPNSNYNTTVTCESNFGLRGETPPQIVVQHFATGSGSELHQVDPIVPAPPGQPHISYGRAEGRQHGDAYSHCASQEIVVGTAPCQTMLRPSTLSVINYQENQITESSNSLIPSSRSLVTLSPDTVDYVLNQDFRESTQKQSNFVRPDDSGKDSDGVLTLSPGKTSLIVKSSNKHQSKSINASLKSSSIEFSPRSFLLEMDKCGNQHQTAEEYNSYTLADKNLNRMQFLHSKNASVMLSESAASNRNEMLYVNSNLIYNPLKEPGGMASQTDATVLTEGMVGGYGIGYEADAEQGSHVLQGAAHFNTGLSDVLQPYEMECDSAKSSSSLLNDWLDVSRMEEHDIEQLQRELEVGSPMCIDEYNFKPD